MIRAIDDDDDDSDFYPTVPRVPPRCPRCGKNRARCTGQNRSGVTRYHRCLSCGQRFRSMEVEPPSLDQVDEEKS